MITSKAEFIRMMIAVTVMVTFMTITFISLAP
jgi:hypothetical protein